MKITGFDENSMCFLFGSRYDVTEWADRHPGGRYALDWARGSDVSGAFHTIHLFSARRVDQILAALPRVDGASEHDEARPRIDSVPMTEQVVTKMDSFMSAGEAVTESARAHSQFLS